MNMGFELKLTQEQRLIMTMEMQQSIKLLQMSSYELLQYIDKELQENVVLDIDNSYDKLKDYQGSSKQLNEYRGLIKYLEFDNYNSGSYYQEDYNEQLSPLNFISNTITLKDYLKDQIMYSNFEKDEEFICNYIIDNIDNRGYLDRTIVNDVADELKISNEIVLDCLKKIQELEPVGIGARSLSECLIIQLHRKGIYDEVLEVIINKYLYEVSKGRYRYIGKELNIKPFKVQEYADIIKDLEPKPSRGFFTGEEIGYIIPDVYIRKLDREYIVIMNDNVIPKLIINNTYRSVIENSSDKSTVNYVKGKINNALFLIKSIENRKNTLCKVMNEIVKVQKDYFDKGDKYLKPMTIRYIAQNLEMHESTVSRAIRDKYVALSNGEIKSIKSLFTNHMNFSNEDVSTNNVKSMITKIIEAEKKTKPLSDLAICESLNKNGVSISRRTVAKYREELGIKSSAQRRRLL